MAKRERNKRAARKARQAERERVAAAQSAAGANAKEEKRSLFKKSESRPAKSSKAPAKVDRSTFWGKIIGYFQDVRSEMRKVTWPSRTELRNYSVAVIVMLVIFGVAIWAIDTLIVGGLVAFTGLRG